MEVWNSNKPSLLLLPVDSSEVSSTHPFVVFRTSVGAQGPYVLAVGGAGGETLSPDTHILESFKGTLGSGRGAMAEIVLGAQPEVLTNRIHRPRRARRKQVVEGGVGA